MTKVFVKQEEMPDLFAFLLKRVEKDEETSFISIRNNNGIVEMDIQLQSKDWKVIEVYAQPEAVPVETVAKSLIKEE